MTCNACAFTISDLLDLLLIEDMSVLPLEELTKRQLGFLLLKEFAYSLVGWMNVSRITSEGSVDRRVICEPDFRFPDIHVARIE
jgi:hypothetical protein